MFNHIKLMGRPGSDGNGGVEREEGMQDLIYLFFSAISFHIIKSVTCKHGGGTLNSFAKGTKY